MNTGNNQEIDIRQLKFMGSRIPAEDALTTFIPEGTNPPPAVQAIFDEIGFSRWIPSDGGHKVILPLPQEGIEYDKDHFHIEKGAWDHEHCKLCSTRIEPMTLCWVTESGPYILLCVNCYEDIKKST